MPYLFMIIQVKSNLSYDLLLVYTESYKKYKAFFC